MTAVLGLKHMSSQSILQVSWGFEGVGGGVCVCWGGGMQAAVVRMYTFTQGVLGAFVCKNVAAVSMQGTCTILLCFNHVDAQ